VKYAFTRTRSEKDGGYPGVLEELLKALGDVVEQWETNLCNSIVHEGKISSDWKKSGKIRWMCGVTLKDRKASEKLRLWLGIVSVSNRVC
jgi:hypothetical protein